MIAYQGTISFTLVDIMIWTERQYKKKVIFVLAPEKSAYILNRFGIYRMYLKICDRND